MWNTTTLQKAACGKDGHEWRTCLKCGEKDVRTLPKTGEHTFAGREYSTPTATSGGCASSTVRSAAR